MPFSKLISILEDTATSEQGNKWQRFAVASCRPLDHLTSICWSAWAFWVGTLAVDIIFLNCAFNQPLFLAIRVFLVFLCHCLCPLSICHGLMMTFLARTTSICFIDCLLFFCVSSFCPVLALFLVQSFSFFSVSPIVYEGKQMYYRTISAWIIFAKLSLASAGSLRLFVLNGQSRSARCIERTRQRRDSRQLQCERN